MIIEKLELNGFCLTRNPFLSAKDVSEICFQIISKILKHVSNTLKQEKLDVPLKMSEKIAQLRQYIRLLERSMTMVLDRYTQITVHQVHFDNIVIGTGEEENVSINFIQGDLSPISPRTYVNLVMTILNEYIKYAGAKLDYSCNNRTRLHHCDLSMQAIINDVKRVISLSRWRRNPNSRIGRIKIDLELGDRESEECVDTFSPE